jgi:hypothetical protein
MRVFEPSLSLDQDQVRLVCGVVISSEERSWQIAAPSEFVRFVAPSVVPFLPLATVLCSFLGEDLQIDQAISPAQLDGLRSAAELFAEWWGWSVPNIQVAGETAEGLSALSGFPGSISISADATAPEIAARLDQVRSWLEQSELDAVAERVESWWATQLSSVPPAKPVAT